MDDELRSLLAAALSAPDDLTPRLVLADWLRERNDPRVQKVQRNCEVGDIHLRTYSYLGSDGVGASPSVAFLVVQFVPQTLAIEFGCRCVERVLPAFAREWSADQRPEQLIASIRGWLRGEVKKTRVGQLAAALADVAGDEAVRPSSGEEWDRPREEARSRAVAAARSAVGVGAAVSFPGSSDRWAPELCHAAIAAMHASASRARERTWQQQELLRLLQADATRP